MNSLKLLLESPKAVTATNWLLMLLFLWLLSQFVWSFWPQAKPTTTAIQSVTNSAPQFNLNQVLSANLFGAPEKAAAAPTQITAPVTRLNLKLRGVYASEEDYASAMIEHNRKQEVYRLGSKLPGAAGLTLYRVLSDRIIMSRNGKYETLYIEDYKGGSDNRPRKPTVVKTQSVNPDPAGEREVLQASTDQNVIDRRKDNFVTEQMAKLRENLNDISDLAQLVQVSAVTDDQGFTGFRVSPGQNRALFSRLGLRRNDIVTAINDIALNDPSAGATILVQMQTADEIILSIKRGNSEKTVKFRATPE